MENNLGNRKTMADNIRRYLYLDNVAAIDVCNALEIPESTFSYWLNAKSYPRIDKIEKMAKFFGCTKSDLVEEYVEVQKIKKAAEGEFGSLSEGEIEFVKLFRMLPDDRKQFLIDMAKQIAALQS